MKRRIKKIWAITIVAFLLIFNAFFFIPLKYSLTGQGRPGGVLALIAGVSYMILRKRDKLQVGHEQPHVQSHQKTITKTDTHNNKESETASMSIQQTIVDKEKIYGLIAEEIDSGSMDKGLWTRLFAECNGDEKKTKVLYIKQRAKRLIQAEQARMEQEEQIRIWLNQEQQGGIGEQGIYENLSNDSLNDTSKNQLNHKFNGSKNFASLNGQIWTCVCGNKNPYNHKEKYQICKTCRRNRDFVLENFSKNAQDNKAV